MNANSLFMLVGLGNPSKKHSLNRHNVGFMAMDRIIHRYNFSEWKKKFKGLYSQGTIDSNKILALKPATFMNLSGESVLSMASFYKIPPQNIIVFYDELDIKVGRLKIQTGGGNNGHNGLKSIDSHIGKNYTKVKIGIGRPQNKEDVAKYVLSDFTKSDIEIIYPLLDNISAEINLLLEGMYDKFTNNIFK